MNQKNNSCFKTAFLKKKISLALIVTLFFSVLSSHASAYSQDQVVINYKNITLSDLLDVIETQTSYRFLYQNSEIPLNKVVSINYSGGTDGILKFLFNNTNVEAVKYKGQIILRKKKSIQDRIIRGTVVDENNTPMFGATIMIKKSKRGTSSDEKGNYQIKAQKGDILLFTFIGYADKEVVVGDQDVINVQLDVDMNTIEEVVLIGYGNKERSKISTAISTLAGKDLNSTLQSGGTFDRALSGAVKGLRVVQGSGRPGSGTDVNIRGFTSPFTGSSNNPLYVIDGVPFQGGDNYFSGSDTDDISVLTEANNPLLSINPDDILSINVLKDAASTAIYGSRGANGVIIIKTREGQRNQRTQVTLSSKSTFSEPINQLKYLDAEGYKDYVDVLLSNSAQGDPYSLGPFFNQFKEFGTDAVLDPFDPFGQSFSSISYDRSKATFGNANTNWQDVIYRDAAYTQEHNIRFAGGGENTTYSLSLRHLDQEGLLKADEFEQYNTRLNLSFSPSEKLKIGTSLNVGVTKNETGFHQGNITLSGLASVRPDMPVYDEKGNLNKFSRFDYFLEEYNSPLAITSKNKMKTKGKTITGNIYAQYEVIDNLKLKMSFSGSHFITDINNYWSKNNYAFPFVTGFNQESRLVIGNTNSTNFISDFTANYLKTFNEKHSVDILAGFTRNRDFSETTQNIYVGFANDLLIQPQKAKKVEEPIQTPDENGLNSYLGRINYDFDNKYNVTAAIRLDQSSKFPEENRNAWFPSVAVGWNAHNEEFFSGSDKINQLKLRFSYGETGSTNVPSFAFLQQFIATTGIRYNGGIGVTPSSILANPLLTWEKTKEFNVGLNFALLDYAIKGDIDLYRRRTNNALMPSPYALETGASSFTDNLATLENKGVEVSVDFQIINKVDFNWNFSVNATKNINKLISYDNSYVPNYFQDSYEEGKEINLIRGYVVKGIFQDDATVQKLNADAGGFYDRPDTQAGDYYFEDISGPDGKKDGRITADDRVILGSTQPDLFGGFRTSFGYKGITLDAGFNYSVGAESIRRSRDNDPLGTASPYVNIEESFGPKYRWSQNNTSATLPRIGLNTSHNSRVSSAIVYDASFLRLNNIRLGYELPMSVTEKLNVGRINLYVSGNNLYTWTKFPGLNPDSQNGYGAMPGSSSNLDSYPISKSFTLGLNVSF